ncbi:PH domain-containing protein [Propioniciclava tarda]|uniref:PH domain-containing protein n=1 Tax=Propioniciclava tarda TaxID=433330 RepID=A0A4Q9KL01_PROTD|nr:PH domain-containing protein [Propioniciclava tarda]TBT95138.1 PH domain-containing protein [Propioniciclava tarda]SMO51281.1 PH domain-containing protein [Propioniciclava tarda]
MSFFAGLLSPRVERHLLSSEGEFVVDQVERHWITRVPGLGLVLLGIVCFVAMPLLRQWWAAGLWAGLILGLVGIWKIHTQNMDRFVVTNMRVFRVHGVLNQEMASVPIARLLDITMNRPLLGQVLNYGHFVFETAAQDQGLKRVPYVPDIVRRDLMIQTVIQRSGLRAQAGDASEYDDFFDEASDADPSRLARIAGRLRRRRSPQSAGDGS